MERALLSIYIVHLMYIKLKISYSVFPFSHSFCVMILGKDH